MSNLLRTDFYRMIRMRSFWVCIVISIVSMLMVAGLISWVASPDFAAMLNDSVSEETLEGVSESERVEAQADMNEALDDIQPVNDKVMRNITYTWAGAFLDGGFLGVIGSLFAGIFLMMDFKGGFIKNLPLDRRGRIDYFSEKLIFVALIQAIFLAICAMLSALFFWMFGFTYESQDPALSIALWLALSWLICTAYAFIVSFVTWLVRSEALSTVVVIVVSSGFFGALLTQIISYLATMIPVFAGVPQWLLVSTFADLRDGSQHLMDAGTEGIFAAMPLSAHVAIVTGIYIIVAVALIMFVCRKQDIRK